MNETAGRAALLIAFCAAAAVAAGLVLSGGPIQARKESRDQQRLDHLRQIGVNIECQFTTLRRLPDAPAATETCPGLPILTDPTTGAPYEYARIDERHWRVCAAFELPERVTHESYGAQFDAERGCLVFTLPPDAMTATLPMQPPERAPAD